MMRAFLVTVKTAFDKISFWAIGISSGAVAEAAIDEYGACGVTVSTVKIKRAQAIAAAARANRPTCATELCGCQECENKRKLAAVIRITQNVSPAHITLPVYVCK